MRAQTSKPLRLGVAGVTHGHLHEVIVRMERGDFEVVGVAEPDAGWRENTGLRKKLDASLFYADLGECWIRRNRKWWWLMVRYMIIWL